MRRQPTSLLRQLLCCAPLFSLGACGESDGGAEESTSAETEESGEAGSGMEAAATSEAESASASEAGPETGPTSGDGDGDVSSTGDGDAESGDGDGDGDGDGPLPDFMQMGPHSVSSTPGSMTTGNGCDLMYEVHTPDTLRTDTRVYMAHGFQRTIADQAAMAQHAASFGMEVVTVSLCTNGFVGVDHARNGEAIAQLAQSLGGGARVHSGFSAGGLAAFVAASQDSAATGFMGLDAVDNGSVGSDAAAGFNLPILAAIAEPGQCNTNNNFLPVYAGIGTDARVVKVVGAAHFDYEADSCEGLACSFCAPAGGEIHSMARGMVASALAELTGAYPGADAWWFAGSEPYNTFQGAGRIEAVQ